MFPMLQAQSPQTPFLGDLDRVLVYSCNKLGSSVYKHVFGTRPR